MGASKLYLSRKKSSYKIQMHYSYLYGDNYFYGKDLIELIDDVTRDREALRGQKLLRTSFPEDLKNKVLGIDRDIHKNQPKGKEYVYKGTTYKDGKVVPAEDVGRL